MREIKLKCIHKDTKEINEVSAIDWHGNWISYGEIEKKENGHIDLVWRKLNLHHLIEFTGFKDKNGVEIYQGDIIDLCQSKYEGEHNLNVIIFENGCFCAKDELTTRNLHETISIGIDYEVIGNIYKNPELLEKCNN